MNANIENTNGTTNIALKSQSLLQPYAEIKEWFHKSKNSKRESEVNYKKKLYHIQNKEYVSHVNTKMSWKENISPTINVFPEKKDMRK